jgi:hypothetical protein
MTSRCPRAGHGYVSPRGRARSHGQRWSDRAPRSRSDPRLQDAARRHFTTGGGCPVAAGWRAASLLGSSRGAARARAGRRPGGASSPRAAVNRRRA